MAAPDPFQKPDPGGGAVGEPYPGHPPPGYGPAPPASPVRRPPSRAGLIVALAGFGVTVAGLFALPLNAYDFPGGNVGFVQTRSLADFVRADSPLYSGLARFWWRFGAFTVTGAVLVLLCLLVAGVAARVLAIVLAAVALVGAVVHGLAMAQSADYRAVQQFQAATDSDFFDHPGAGVFVSLAGFAIVLVGGVLVAAIGRTPRALPPPPPPGPAAPPR